MRKEFPGHYRPKDSEIELLWSECIFAFDANVLLNSYRYSEPTRKVLLGYLSKLRARIWISYQVGLEFHRNRHGVLSEQIKSYEGASQSIGDYLDNLRSPYRHPFVSESLLNDLASIVERLRSELQRTHDDLEKYIQSDPVLDELAVLFEGKVGPQPDSTAMTKFTKEAERRILEQIPPGYKDKGKSEGKSLGDAIGWMQLLEHATNAKKPVIFVTDDGKEDWWSTVRGKTIGPRPELIQEFRQCTNLAFHMYSPDRFMEYAAKHFHQPQNPSILEEVRKVSQDTLLRQWSVFEENRAKRKKTAHERFSTILSHALEHRENIANFVLSVRSVEHSVWVSVRSPMHLPPHVIDGLDAVGKDLQCILRIASQVREMSDAEWVTFLTCPADFKIPLSLLKHLGYLRRMPQQALDLTQTFSSSSPRKWKPTDDDKSKL